ncbi:hypothetical protein [Castellaniella sp.]|uniref:hypothetical protein n=1 Tax=Castellaniella sp. TaxID=1955812 RepID=UPI00355DFC92
MKTSRNFTDHEIACYVLGIEISVPRSEIENALAHDNAAAARALKWEAYFLGIVDVLPRQTPDGTVLAQIESTLGMRALPDGVPPSPMGSVLRQVPGTPGRNADPNATDAHPERRAGRAVRQRLASWLRRRRLPLAIVLLVLGAVLLLVIWAGTRDVPSTMVSETIRLQGTP